MVLVLGEHMQHAMQHATCDMRGNMQIRTDIKSTTLHLLLHALTCSALTLDPLDVPMPFG